MKRMPQRPFLFALALVVHLTLTANAAAKAPGPGEKDAAPGVLQQADKLYKGRLFQECIAVCDRAIAEKPSSSELFYRRGMAYYRLRKYDPAMADLSKAISLDSGNSNAFNGRANVFYDLKRYAEAIKNLDECLRLDPKKVVAYTTRATCWWMLGDTAAALADIDHALKLDPKNANALKNRGMMQLKSKKATNAVPGKAPSGPAATATPGSREMPSLPQVTFKAGEDPCAAAKKTPLGLPWQKADPTPVRLPAGAEPVTLAPALDFKTLSSLQYNGAVSVAMEAMRILYGNLMPEQEKRFQFCWAPLFDYPTAQAVDYLNRLNPLLGQFLAGRESFVRTAGAIQGAMFDAGLAVAADSKAGYIDALALIERQTQVLRALEAGLARLASQIQELGNPPNPLAAKCRDQGRYKRAAKALIEPMSDGEHIGEWECWVENLDDPADQDSILNPYLNELKTRWTGVGNYMHFLIVEADYFDGRKLRTFIQNHDPQQKKSLGRKENSIAVYVGEWPDRGWFPGMKDEAPEVSGDGMVVPYKIEIGGEVSNWRCVFRRVGDRLEELPLGWRAEDIARIRKLADEGLKRDDLHYSVDKLHVRTAINQYLQERRENLAMREAFHRAAQQYLKDIPAAKRNRQDFNILEQYTWKHLGTLAKETPAIIAQAGPVAAAKPAGSAKEEEARAETIAFHQSIIELLDRNLQKEFADLGRDLPGLSQKDSETRRGQLQFRIIQLQSDIQAEQDLVASYQTGRIIHTRSAFDVMAHEQLIGKIREEAARSDAVRRIAVGVERQIELLPAESRAAVRQKVRATLDAKTLASGDVEKARRLAVAVNNQVQGYWQGERARQEEKAIAAEEGEFIAGTVVMAAGVMTVGFGHAAFVEAFGETAALAAWMPQIIGGVYGGTTGFIAGGPAEGLKQTVSWASPAGSLAVSFLEGYQHQAADPKSGLGDRLWAGASQAGTGYIMGKAMQFGSSLVSKGSLAYFGPKSRLFKPVNWSKPTVQQQFDAARFQQDVNDARQLVTHFEEKQAQLQQLRRQTPAASPQVKQLQGELKSMAASLNSSYHCKWLIKYDASPAVRRQFSQLVDQSYRDMTPGMIQRLKKRGYETDNLKFKPLRNASSAGTSSMDLDLALEETPDLVIIKDNKPVTLQELQKDAQQALNESYHQVTGFNANRSELALTTSVHPEAFASKKLLGQDVDFGRFTREEMASIGKVVQVKMDKIRGDPVLGEISKLQSQCRESSKEIENMLLKNLKQKLAKAAPGSSAHQQLQADIGYWQDISAKFKRMSAQTTNPYEILEIDRAIRQTTGGKGSRDVIRDLAAAF